MAGNYSVPENTASGALFWRDSKKHEKAPDLGGTLTFDIELIRSLMAMYQNGEELAVDISAWRRTSAKGEFLSVMVKKKWVPGGGQRVISQQPPARQMAQRGPAPRVRPPEPDDMDSEIPF
jgi:hypothetical protein